jgi:L-ascorbate metabolism protein UlaG (beta-lactamase superfamily)
MVITYHGGQFFKVVHGDTVIAFDPIAKQNPHEWPVSKFGANVVLSSLHHPSFFGVDQVTSGNRHPFVIHGPGEYEVGDITVRGFGVLTTYDNKERYTTVYQMQFEGMNLVFLGALGSPDIGAHILGELSDIDILFVPIGGGDVLEAPQASKLAVKLEAKVIVPMHYNDTSLATFLDEEGKEDVTPVEKLTVKRKDVATMQGEVVVLTKKI